VRILVVDDEPAVRTALQRALRLDGYDVELAEGGASALAALATAGRDAVLLDVLMPGVDGLEVCRELRRRGDHTPVLMLTARDGVADRVAGLDAGADDYLVKPFHLDELLARVRALLMLTARDGVADRVAGLDAGADDYLVKPFHLDELLARVRALLRRSGLGGGTVLRVDDLSLDPVAHEVRRGGRLIGLTRTEFQLLELFLVNARQVLNREIIFDRIWGYDFGPASNCLEVYIRYLRRKTEAAGEARLIHTVRGVGYVLRP